MLLSTHSLLTRSTHVKRYIGYNISSHNVYPPLLKILLVLSITPPHSLKNSLLWVKEYFFDTISLLTTGIRFPTYIRMLLWYSEVATKHFISTRNECYTQNIPFHSFHLLGRVGKGVYTSPLLSTNVHPKIPHSHSLSSFVHSFIVCVWGTTFIQTSLSYN